MKSSSSIRGLSALGDDSVLRLLFSLSNVGDRLDARLGLSSSVPLETCLATHGGDILRPSRWILWDGAGK